MFLPTFLVLVLFQVSVTLRDTMTVAIMEKEEYLIAAGYRSRSLIHYHYGGKHGSTHADMGLEKELRVQHLNRKVEGRNSKPLDLASASETSSLLPMTNFLQQGHRILSIMPLSVSHEGHFHPNQQSFFLFPVRGIRDDKCPPHMASSFLLFFLCLL